MLACSVLFKSLSSIIVKNSRYGVTKRFCSQRSVVDSCYAVLVAGMKDILRLGKSNHKSTLYAGSKGRTNREDVMTTHHLLLQRNFKPENIITFSYNEYLCENSAKGSLPFRGPTITDQADILKGTTIAYSGEDVTPDHFLAAITGDKGIQII